MFSASVNARPLNAMSFFNKSFTTFGDKVVACFGVESNDGMNKCATITLPNPSLIISLKGYNSNESILSLECLITGNAK